MVYGYCMISSMKQSIDRQVRNILTQYPNACIIKEEFDGKTAQRTRWEHLKYIMLHQAKCGESITVVFNSISRMGQTAEECFLLYKELYEAGVELVFLKEHYIDTLTYKTVLRNESMQTDTNMEMLLKGVECYFMALLKKQIKIAFEQSEKELQELRNRTKEGLSAARKAGKHVGRRAGVKVETQKQRRGIEVIKRRSFDFGGDLNDAACQALIGCSRNSYYKYKRLARV